MSRQGQLAYTVDWVDTNIYLHSGRGWRNGAPGPFDKPVAVVKSSWIDHSPAFSPNGERIVFVSNRSGTLELWVSHRDGSGAVRLTSMNSVSTGAPCWSPDGRRIAFDSWASGRSGIYVVEAAGGVPKLLSAEPLGSWHPAWSADGKWIYFTCGRSGQRNIWKVPATGGDAVQVTHDGAVRALPSPDGKLIYFTKPGPRADCCVIWSIPAGGGAEKAVSELETFGADKQRSWGVLERGIYFITVEPASRPVVQFLSFETRHVNRLFTLQKNAVTEFPALSLSADGRYALTAQVEHAINDLMMITNFR
jgi:Tol biopolymer transport system component